VNLFLSDVLDAVNPGEWAAGPYTDGNDSDNAIFYRTAKASIVSHFSITPVLREIDEWTLRPSTHTSAAANFRVYAVHLKASQGSDEEQQRLAEVTLMRSRMETFALGGSYAVVGDFNIYTATEPAYQYMISPANGAAGVLQDPIQREGNWHINPAFADIHTQSPRTAQFGGGANGGMDDRFDLILASPFDVDGEGFDILPSTYTAFGQDGAHFDTSLIVAPYTVVDSVMARRLHDASDHLPVFADYQLAAVLQAAGALDVGTVIVGAAPEANLSVLNAAAVPADELDYSFAPPAGFTAPPGSFQAEPGASNLHAIGMDASTAGAKGGTLVIASDDPDRPAANVALTGTVLDHAVPSAIALAQQLVAPLDLGLVAPSDTAEASAEVHNFGFDALHSALEVHASELTGDPRFHLGGDFAPATVGAVPASWPVRFDAVGAADGPYTGTLVFHTRDLPGHPGAIDLDDIQFDLTVTVSGSAVAVHVRPVVARTGFVSVRPNPFRDVSDIRFGLARPAHARLLVIDVTGRAVRTILERDLAAGEHGVVWDGRDGGGRHAAPGIYFLRLEAGNVSETRKVARLR
jgi:hypothetical protein